MIRSDLPASIPSIVSAHRSVPKARRVKRTKVSEIIDRSGLPDQTGGWDLSILLSSIVGGIDGVRKMMRAAAWKSVRRAFAQYDFHTSSDMANQIVEDTAESAWEAVLYRFGSPESGWNPRKGAVSTWVYHTVWYVVSNHIRDHIIPNMMASSLQGHADRDGASVQQGADRFMADHAGKCHIDRDRLIDDEDMAEARKRLDTLSDRERTVLLSSLDDSDTDDALSVRMGLSRSALSQIRASLRDKGIESKRCKLH